MRTTTHALAIVLAIGALLLPLGCRRGESKEQATPVPIETTDSPSVSKPEEPALSEPRPGAPAPGQPDPRATYHVPLEGNEPQRGPDDALMTIVEFGDFQCPYCKRAEPVMRQILETYPDEVRIVWLNFPQQGHLGARPAANAALEAQAQRGDDAFWAMHDKIFGEPGGVRRQDLERYAEELGLDLEEVRAAMDTDRYGDILDRESALARRLGVPGTPSWYMNGRFMAGFPFQTWKFTIDRRIIPVRRAVESGIPRDELYDRIIAEGRTEP